MVEVLQVWAVAVLLMQTCVVATGTLCVSHFSCQLIIWVVIGTVSQDVPGLLAHVNKCPLDRHLHLYSNHFVYMPASLVKKFLLAQ